MKLWHTRAFINIEQKLYIGCFQNICGAHLVRNRLRMKNVIDWLLQSQRHYKFWCFYEPKLTDPAARSARIRDSNVEIYGPGLKTDHCGIFPWHRLSSKTSCPSHSQLIWEFNLNRIKNKQSKHQNFDRIETISKIFFGQNRSSYKKSTFDCIGKFRCRIGIGIERNNFGSSTDRARNNGLKIWQRSRRNRKTEPTDRSSVEPKTGSRKTEPLRCVKIKVQVVGRRKSEHQELLIGQVAGYQRVWLGQLYVKQIGLFY